MLPITRTFLVIFMLLVNSLFAMNNNKFKLIKTLDTSIIERIFITDDEKYIVADTESTIIILDNELEKTSHIIKFSDVHLLHTLGVFGPENNIVALLWTKKHYIMMIMSFHGKILLSFHEKKGLVKQKIKNQLPNYLKTSLSDDQKTVTIYNPITGEHYVRWHFSLHGPECYYQKKMTSDGKYGFNCPGQFCEKYLQQIFFDTGETKKLMDTKIETMYDFSFALTNDDKYIAYSCYSERYGCDLVKILNLKTGTCIRRINTSADKLAIDAKNQYIATSKDQSIKIWDFASGKLLQTIKFKKNSNLNVVKILFSKNTLIFVIDCSQAIAPICTIFIYKFPPENLSEESLTFQNYDLNFYFNKLGL